MPRSALNLDSSFVIRISARRATHNPFVDPAAVMMVIGAAGHSIEPPKPPGFYVFGS
jgi:hypothetical protein